MMHKLLINSALLIIFNLNAQNNITLQKIEQHKKATDTALKWFTLLLEGEAIDSLINISKVPFDVDGELILTSKEALKEIYQLIIKQKGKRALPEIFTKVQEPKHINTEKTTVDTILIIELVLIVKDIRNDVLSVYVDTSEDNMKVIGFKD